MQAPRLLSCKSSCWGKISPGSILQKDEGIPYHTAPKEPQHACRTWMCSWRFLV